MARKKSKPVSPAPPAPELAAPESGPDAAGQSGDLQGLPGREDVDNESVRELVEEGNFYEASVVDGVENAPDPDAGKMRVRRRREDDLPPEYADKPRDEPIE